MVRLLQSFGPLAPLLVLLLAAGESAAFLGLLLRGPGRQHPGAQAVVASAAVVSAFMWAWRRRFHAALALMTALAGQWAIVEVTERLVHRVPPPSQPLVDRIDYGFPSGEVAALTALLVVLAWPWTRPGWSVTTIRFGSAALVMTVAAVARNILVVEYPSDVIAGAAVAVGWSLLVCAAFDRPPPSGAPPPLIAPFD